MKIIEGGLSSDKEKVANYAKVLATNLESAGDVSLAKKIRSTLNKEKGGLATLDAFSSRPVDSESRMDIVDIAYPHLDVSQVVLSRYSRETIQLFVDSYKKRDKLLESGLEPQNTLLLYGPPGCGKTTIAMAISSLTGLPLVTARFDGLVSSLLGSTAKNIRNIFQYASERECILFLDEFDAIAKLRDDKNELGELKRVVNSLIQNIDSFGSSSILIAATNHQELLDPAIWRRFSTVINVEKPQEKEIEELLALLLKDKKNDFLESEKRRKLICSALNGLTHSEIKTIINNSLRNIILSGRDSLSNCDVLKEIFSRENNSIDNEDQLLDYLLSFGATQRDINAYLGIPVRTIQEAAKRLEKGINNG